MWNKIGAIAALAALLLQASMLQAQAPTSEVYMIDMSGVLIYVIIFYLITFISLGMLMLKLLRPKFNSTWLYVLCTVGIIGAGIVTWAFKDVQDTQLPGVVAEEQDVTALSEEMQIKVQQQEREVFFQQFANFWTIAIPNFIILGLTIFVDVNNRRRDPDAPRGRYD